MRRACKEERMLGLVIIVAVVGLIIGSIVLYDPNAKTRDQMTPEEKIAEDVEWIKIRQMMPK